MIMVPEHGLYGEQAYMESVPDTVDPELGVPVVSLYGDSQGSLSPSPEMLSEVDTVVFDLQDVGSRYYTFLATMAMTMEACASAGVRFIVADRPNPIGGTTVEGNLVRPELRSFVGYMYLANRHGMTAGEAATYHASITGLDLDLQVVECKGWNRSARWPDTGLPFVPPSPNIPDWTTAIVYPGMCLLEGTNLSEGRGTTTPFHVFGAPWIRDPHALTTDLRGMDLPGVTFIPNWFIPVADKWAGLRCGGIRLMLMDIDAFSPLLTGIAILSACFRSFPDGFEYRSGAYEFVKDIPAIDLLLGNEGIRHAIEDGAEPRDIIKGMEPERREFLERREPFLIYPP